MQASLEPDLRSPTRQEISAAVTEGVRAPLAALRASMESLSHAFQAEDPRSLAVRGALEEVVRLGHEMQALLDYALPEPARALSCSLLEIAFAARAALPAAMRGQVVLATENGRSRLTVDGTLLSRSITRVLEAAAAETRASILLRSRIDGGEAVFAVVHEAPGGFLGESRGTRLRSAISALSAVLARRDVERMGGRFGIQHDPGGSTVLEIRFPAEAHAEPAGSDAEARA
jgi:signal transduction histidine kinase